MIAVVDDDVCFAEELQDLLGSHGHRSVVVTHPHESSLALLDEASLLILDLALAATSALEVLEELNCRGRIPPVVMVSGSGEETLEAARVRAVQRGFPVLAALPKPLSLPALLGLLATGPREENPAVMPRVVGQGTPVVALRSLEYAGTYTGHWMRMAGPGAGSGTSRQAIAVARQMREVLASRGQRGFVAVSLPDVVLAEPRQWVQLCDETTGTTADLVLEIGPDTRLTAAPRHDALPALRLAGFGLLAHADDYRTVASVPHALPVTMLAIDALRLRPSARSPWLPDTLHRDLERLRRRGVTLLGTGVQSAGDLRRARDFGLDLVTRSACRINRDWP